jgi:hypothetical protein
MSAAAASSAGDGAYVPPPMDMHAVSIDDTASILREETYGFNVSVTIDPEALLGNVVHELSPKQTAELFFRDPAKVGMPLAMLSAKLVGVTNTTSIPIGARFEYVDARTPEKGWQPLLGCAEYVAYSDNTEKRVDVTLNAGENARITGADSFYKPDPYIKSKVFKRWGSQTQEDVDNSISENTDDCVASVTRGSSTEWVMLANRHKFANDWKNLTGREKRQSRPISEVMKDIEVGQKISRVIHDPKAPEATKVKARTALDGLKSRIEGIPITVARKAKQKIEELIIKKNPTIHMQRVAVRLYPQGKQPGVNEDGNPITTMVGEWAKIPDLYPSQHGVHNVTARVAFAFLSLKQ